MSKVYEFHVTTPQEYVLTPSVLFETTGYMCRHFKKLCWHFKPLYFSSCSLSPWGNTLCRFLIISFSDFVLCLYVSTLKYHMSTPDHLFLKVWLLSLCVNTLMTCVDTFIFKLSIVFMCRLLEAMCRHFNSQNCTLFSCVDTLKNMSTPLVQNIFPYFP